MKSIAENNRDVPGYVGFLSNHLLGLAFEYKTAGVEGTHTTACSAFVIEYVDEWILVTTGHIQRDLQGPAQRGEIEILRVRILDGFGNNPKTQEGFVFDIESPLQAFFYRESLGLDVGFMHLRPFYRNQLEANGILPFKEQNWLSAKQMEFDGYLLLGVLQESISPMDGQRTEISSIVTRVFPTDDIPAKLAGENHRFFGTIQPSTLFKSIVGMSGGPLLGFQRQSDGAIAYSIAGLQNSWDPLTRTIAACSSELLQEMFIEWINRERESLGDSSVPLDRKWGTEETVKLRKFGSIVND
jgi:hypothetical protein